MWTPGPRQTRMCSMVVYKKVYYWIVPLLSVLFECWSLGDILYPSIPINAPVQRQTAQPVCYIKPGSFLLLFPPRKKLECKSWGIYKPIYAVLNYIIILIVHLNKGVYKPFAQMQLKYAKMQHLPLPAPLSARVGRLSRRTNSVNTRPSTNTDVFDGGI